MYPARHGARPRDRPSRTHPVELELGHREHPAQKQAPRVGLEVEAVLDRDERAARRADALDERQRVDQ
jgi:hypothetical protein